jgi:hypothetical protein
MSCGKMKMLERPRVENSRLRLTPGLVSYAPRINKPATEAHSANERLTTPPTGRNTAYVASWLKRLCHRAFEVVEAEGLVTPFLRFGVRTRNIISWRGRMQSGIP